MNKKYGSPMVKDGAIGNTIKQGGQIMKCSFCGAEGVKIDLINYGGKAVAVGVSCRYLDNVKEEEGN